MKTSFLQIERAKNLLYFSVIFYETMAFSSLTNDKLANLFEQYNQCNDQVLCENIETDIDSVLHSMSLDIKNKFTEDFSKMKEVKIRHFSSELKEEQGETSTRNNVITSIIHTLSTYNKSQLEPNNCGLLTESFVIKLPFNSNQQSKQIETADEIDIKSWLSTLEQFKNTNFTIRTLHEGGINNNGIYKITFNNGTSFIVKNSECSEFEHMADFTNKLPFASSENHDLPKIVKLITYKVYDKWQYSAKQLCFGLMEAAEGVRMLDFNEEMTDNDYTIIGKQMAKFHFHNYKPNSTKTKYTQFMHGDMNQQNVFWDSKNKKLTLIDLSGLKKIETSKEPKNIILNLECEFGFLKKARTQFYYFAKSYLENLPLDVKQDVILRQAILEYFHDQCILALARVEQLTLDQSNKFKECIGWKTEDFKQNQSQTSFEAH